MSQSDNSEIKRDLSKLQSQRKVVIFFSVLVVLVCVPFLSSWSGLDSETHEIIETVGLGLIAFCILGRAWCSLYIGGRKTKELTIYGPYSISRNPLYMFSFIGAAGAGAQSGSIIVAFFFAMVAFLIFLPVILREEKALHQVFGVSYTAYVQETPRFGPHFRAWKDRASIEVKLPLLYRTLGDGLIFFVSVPFFELIEELQKAGYLTILMNLP